MTIKYKFVTGEEVYIEVYGRLEKIMSRLDHEFNIKYDRRTNNKFVSFENLNKNTIDGGENSEMKY